MKIDYEIEITPRMVRAATAVLHQSGYLDYCSESDQALVQEMLEAAWAERVAEVRDKNA